MRYWHPFTEEAIEQVCIYMNLKIYFFCLVFLLLSAFWTILFWLKGVGLMIFRNEMRVILELTLKEEIVLHET